MNDGSTISGSGLRIAINLFTPKALIYLLASILTNKYGLKISLCKIKDKDQ